MNGSNTLSLNEKLKGRKETERLFAARQSFSVSGIRVFYRFTGEEQGNLRAGFGASKKYLRHAVKRNRAKRLMREVYRKQKHSLKALLAEQPKSLYVFFIYANNELINYSETENAFNVILHKIEKIVQRHLSENP